jgi:hypothetical protein
MNLLSRNPPPINGTIIPPRRFTGWGALYFAAFICLPVIGAGALLDLALYTIFRDGFDACYAVMCLFE